MTHAHVSPEEKEEDVFGADLCSIDSQYSAARLTRWICPCHDAACVPTSQFYQALHRILVFQHHRR